MVERNTRVRGTQVVERSIKKGDMDATGESTGFVLTVQSDGSVDWEAGIASNLNTINDNIMLNAFRIAVNGSLTQFNMIDGIVDEYEDELSVDTANSTNESYDAANDLYSPSGGVQVSVSPFAHYKCNDNAANTTVTDDGSGSNNGTANTNTSNLSVGGQINEAFDLDGSTEFIDVDSLATAIASNTTGSFSFWINPDSFPGAIIDIGDASTANYLFFNIRNSNDIIELNAGGTVQWRIDVGAGIFSTATWQHVVLVQDGTEPKLYVDTQEISVTFSVTTDKTAWFSDLTGIDNGRIGSFNSNNQANSTDYDGQFDDYRYYSNKVLSVDEISAINNAGSGTEDDQPISSIDNMTLISDTFTAEAQPDNARIILFEEDVDAVTENTDLKAFVSRDSGQNFTTDFATDDKLDITSHGFSNDDRIMVTSSSQDLPAGLDAATVYYVINQTTNDFELSLTSSGSAVDITDDGTGTHTAKQVSETTLTDQGDYETGKRILAGSVDISSQPAGTTMEYSLVTINNKDLNIHGTALSWD